MLKTAALTLNDVSDKPRESCGIFGICGQPEAAALTYFGLYALQHRGQESAGIAVARDDTIVSHKGMGLVADVFDVDHLEELAGCCAIGHVRYSTTGSSILTNAQPFIVRHRNKMYAVGHNGNIVNAHVLKEELEQAGSIFQSTMDSEIFLHLFVKNLKLGFEQALVASVSRLEGAFSFVMLTNRGEVVGIRDPHGFRPLCLGRHDGNYVLASESCALDLVEAEFIREIDPGEIVIITRDGMRSIQHPGGRPAGLLHLRAHLLCAAGQHHRRQERLPRAQGPGPPARPGSAGFGRFGDAVPGLGDVRRHRLRGGIRHPLRAGDDPQSLRRPDLHPAHPEHAGFRRAREAQPGARSC